MKRIAAAFKKIFFEPVPPKKKVALCTSLLGVCLFAYYFPLIFNRPLPVGPLGLQPLVLISLYALASILSLALAFEYQIRLSAFVLLILHVLLHGTEFERFGWEGLIGLALLTVFISPVYTKRGPIWPLRLWQLSVCFMYIFVAWAELGPKFWIYPHLVANYVEGSPFGHMVGSYRGFVPLVEIIGGFAWLCQLVAPILLWHRSLAKYLAVMLMVLHGLLEIFMPTPFWNCIMIVGLISFLPDNWLTLSKAYWSRQIPELKVAWRNFSFFIVTATMLFTIFERNIVQQFAILEKIKNETVEDAYKMVSRPFVGVGNLILFNSIWKMYSPTWRHVVWIEWYYRKADGTAVNWPQENFSPEYRIHRRTWWEALWTDFKKEKVFVGMLSGQREKAVYGKYLCHEISSATGSRPLSVHSEIYSFDIRGPEKEWSLKDQAFEQRQVEEEVACD